MKKLLWLDDVRDPYQDTWIQDYSPIGITCEVFWVKSYSEFISWIELNGLPDAICFDHDLADEHYAPQEHWDDKYHDWAKGQNFSEKTGHDCAKWLVEYCLDNNTSLPEWNVQSANPPGKDNINKLLQSFLKHSSHE